MGVWGAGNFDNDMAGEFLDELKMQLIRNVEEAISHNMDIDLDEQFDGLVMPSVDVLITICEQYEVSPMLDTTKVTQWKKFFLSYYNTTIDQYGAKEPYKQNRRKVIEQTFDKLEALSREYPI